MNSDEAAQLHRRAKELFFELMDEPSENWDALLAKNCAGDEVLAREVASLLANRDTETDHLMPEIDAPSRALPSELSEALMAELAGKLRVTSDPSERGARRSVAAGEVFAGRYRMQARIGAGGMGEVWRAHDQMLDETVALKFIRSKARGAAWVRRLLRETTIARRVSHRNVCRVHDAGAVDGEFFLSMEYVPGPDLAQKLQRDGRFKRGPSKQLARELVDALVAVHSIGLLHRDLKPANILLGEDIVARVSDFGLAISSDESSTDDSRSGTRAYMAPEQQRGEAPSEASDIYALGLILYEAVTNRRAFRSGDEIQAAADGGELPPRPSVLVARTDALLEHLILRCLAPDPAERPSALELQTALNLDDPLEAVLSLGDVPSAEVIASSRSRPPLGPRATKQLAAGYLALLALTMIMTRVGGIGLLPDVSPAEQASKARALLQELGGPSATAGRFERYSYSVDPPVFERSELRLFRGEDPDATPLNFWYRSGNSKFSPVTATNQLFGYGRTTLFDPPADDPGMSSLLLDRAGQLVYLSTHPVTPTAGPTTGELPVGRFFELAGLNLDEFDPVAPLHPFPSVARTRLAWTHGDSALRVELAGTGERAFSFAVLEPAAVAATKRSSVDLLGLINYLLILGLFAATIPKALRHFRSGRGDPWVSLRVAMLVGFGLFVAWLAYADFPGGSVATLVFVMSGAFMCLASGIMIWVFSVAIEPSVQRRWPRTFITWSRLFRGFVSGPGVHSDLLIGMCIALVPAFLHSCAPLLIGMPSEEIYQTGLLRGTTWRAILGSIAEVIPGAVLLNFEFVAVLTILGWMIRHRATQVIVTGMIACILGAGACTTGLGASIEALGMALILFCLVRYGLLASFAAILGRHMLETFPMSHSPDTWYASASYASIAFIIVTLGWVVWPLMRDTERKVWRSD